MLKGRESEAREVLRKTASKLGQEGIESELEDIRQTLKSATKQNIVQEIKLLLKWRNLKRYSNCILTTCFLCICLHCIYVGSYWELLFICYQLLVELLYSE